jgi:hypothetical protein
MEPRKRRAREILQDAGAHSFRVVYKQRIERASAGRFDTAEISADINTDAATNPRRVHNVLCALRALLMEGEE